MQHSAGTRGDGLLDQGELFQISVVIVTHNTVDLVINCISSLYTNRSHSLGEVIVVDNASTDGTVAAIRDRFPEVRLVCNTENIGFGAANNQGVAVSVGQYVLLLNSDTIMQGETLDLLLAALKKDERVALVGPTLIGQDGVVQRSAFRFLTPGVLLLEQSNIGRFLSTTPNGDGKVEPDNSLSCDWLLGACVMARRDLLLAFGPFDPIFFMYAEDMDLCYRLKTDGWEIRLVPEAAITHIGGGTTRLYYKEMAIQLTKSLYLFYLKHYRPIDLFLAVLIIRTIANAKLLRDLCRSALATISGRAEQSRRLQALAGIWAATVSLSPGSVSEPRPVARPNVRAETAEVDEERGRAELSRQIGSFTQQEPLAQTRHGGALAGRGVPAAARGSVVLIVVVLATSVLNYGFSILMSWLLSVAEFGMLSVVQTMLLLGATAIGAGFPWALAQAISQYDAVPERLLRSSLIANTGLGLAIGGILSAIGISHLADSGEDYLWLTTVAGGTVGILAFQAVFAATLQGLRRVEALGVVRCTEVAIKFASGGILVLLGVGPLGAIIGAFGGALASAVLATILVRGLVARQGPLVREFAIYLKAPPFFLSMFSLAALLNADLISIKLFGPADTSEQLAGYYQAAAVLGRTPVFLALALVSAVFPYIANRSDYGDTSNAYAELALKYTLIFIVPINIALMILPDAAMTMFFSSGYAAGAGPLRVLAIGTILLSFIHVLAILLQAGGKLWLPTNVLGVAAVFDCVILALLVPHFGMMGAAASLIITSAASLFVLVPAGIREFRLLPTVRGTISYLFCVALFALTLWVLPTGNRLATVAVFIVAAFVYLFALWFSNVLNNKDLLTLANALGPRATRMTLGFIGQVSNKTGIRG